MIGVLSNCCSFDIKCKESIINQYAIVVTQAGVHCLICTHDARGRAAPEGECVNISQCIPACVTTNMLHFKSQLSR